MGHIQELANEVLEEIFVYLSPKMIKTASLVCRRWNNVIGDSRKFMSKFHLKLLGPEKFEKYKEQLPLRQHQFASIHYIPEDFALSIHQGALCGLIFDHCKLKARDFIQLVNSQTSLKELNIAELLLTGVELLDQHEKITVPIKKLSISQNLTNYIFSDVNDVEDVIGLFNITSLLELEAKFFVGSREVSDFATRQLNLKKLSISGMFPKHTNENVDLTKVEYFVTSVYFDLDYFRPLIKRNLPTIKELHVQTECIYGEISDLEQLPFNTHVKLVYLAGEVNLFVVAFLQKFKNLEHLSSNDPIAKDVLHAIQRAVPNLKTLSLLANDKLDQKYFQDVYFSKLEDIHLIQECNDDFFDTFIPRHADTLEKINIKRIAPQYNEKFIEEIQKCKKLKSVEARVSENFITSLYTKLMPRTNPLTIKLLFANQAGFSCSICYTLPDDLAIFNKHREIWLQYKSKNPTSVIPLKILERITDEIMHVRLYHKNFLQPDNLKIRALASLRLLSTLATDEIATDDSDQGDESMDEETDEENVGNEAQEA